MVRSLGRLRVPAVRLFLAGYHIEQRGLTGAVWAAQADAVTCLDVPVDVVEQHMVPEGFMEGGELQQLFTKRLGGDRQDLSEFRHVLSRCG